MITIVIITQMKNGLNALHLASKEGHMKVITELLARGAHVDAVTKVGSFLVFLCISELELQHFDD